MHNFALIGGAGCIALEHIRAIRDTGNNLAAVLDPDDNQDILDEFPECEYFKDINAFREFLAGKKNDPGHVDGMVICSPSYLHYQHIIFALENHCDVICECPLVLKASHLKALMFAEKEYGRKIYPFLQLKYHPWVLRFKEKIKEADCGKIFDVKLVNITSRGKWYRNSWKNDPTKSGGLTTVLGFQYFDLLINLFGKVVEYKPLCVTSEHSKGTLVLEKANVDWFFSIDSSDLPHESEKKGEKNFVQLRINKTNTLDLNKLPALFYATYYGILRNNSAHRLEDLESLISFLQHL